MDKDPFLKILATTTLATTALNISAQEHKTTDQFPSSSTSTEAIDLRMHNAIMAVIANESKLAAGKEEIKLEKPARAIYSADDLAGHAPFLQSPEFNASFWSSRLEVELVNQDTTHAYLARSPDETNALNSEAQLQKEGYTDPSTGSVAKYVTPEQYIIVSVNQATNTVTATLCGIHSQTPLGSFSVKIGTDIDATLQTLTQGVQGLI